MKPLDYPLTTSSYRQYQLEQIGADIKESICRVSDGPFDAEQNANIPTVSYEVWFLAHRHAWSRTSWLILHHPCIWVIGNTHVTV